MASSNLDTVVLSGLVVLKIIKHCKESLPQLVTGQLLGLDVGNQLEVTHCFPFPSQTEDAEAEGEGAGGADYQVEMMRCLREVNVDNNTVGWYQSTYLGSFMTETMIESQFNYQENISNSVVVVFDPLKTTQGSLSLKAYRLTPNFMELYRAGEFDMDSIRNLQVTSNQIFCEVPVKINNSNLVDALLLQLEDSRDITCDYDRLDLTTNPFLEKNLEFLVECVDDLAAEQNKFQYYQRNVARQVAHQQALIQKKKAEIEQRRRAGEDIPQEELATPTFKPIPSPSRLESLLVTHQINKYCQQVNQFAGQSFSKLFLVSGLHGSE